ncbi:MAG: hypothetical protein ACE5I1_13460 [bacterium]
MQIKKYFCIAAILIGSLKSCVIFSQTQNYVRPGQLFSVQIEKSDNSHLNIQLTPTHLRGQDTIIFSAIERLPDSALQLDYGRFFRNVQATSHDGQSLAVRRLSTNKWEITGGASLHHVTYEVSIHETEDVIKDQLATGRRRPGYLFLPGAAILGWLDGHENGHQRIDINAPENWQIVSNIEATGDGAFAVNHFFELHQAKFAIGNTINVNRFSAFDVPHTLTVYYDNDVFPSAVGNILATVSKSANILYKNAPFQDYFAFIELLKTVPPGRNGSSRKAHAFMNGLHIIIPMDNVLSEQIHYEMLTYYLQTWLSHKRYFKAGIENFYSKKYAYREWLLEGLSKYYSARLLTQTGFMQMDNFLQKIVVWANDVNWQSEKSIRDSQTTADIATHPHSAWASRGALLGLLLDVQILYQSRGYKRLDDGLQALEKAFLSTNEKMQITQFPHIIKETTGIEVESFFHTYMETQADIPFEKAFSILGLQPGWQNARLVDLTMKQPEEISEQTRQLRQWWLKKIILK